MQLLPRRCILEAMVTKNAYAKINLGLRILNKRGDGFHEIETIFHRVNIFDTISLEQSNTISLVSSEKSLPCDISNLCVKAATKLQERYCVQEGVKIILQKNIPIGAGLGGGSADAVANCLV